MSTITEAEPARRAVVELPEPTVLHGLTYGEYVRLRQEPENRHLRMVYHDGVLEMMSPESTHEVSSRQIGLFVFILCEELGIDSHDTGSTTFQQGTTELKKGNGKEPDSSFYFASAHKVLGRDPIHLDRDPPPDLWFEVDNRASSRGRLPLYAALGIPEVWRYDVRKDKMSFGALVEGQRYEALDHSLSLPMLTPALVEEALEMGRGVFQRTWAARLRPWIRENFGQGPA